jgi:hypothetical protein
MKLDRDLVLALTLVAFWVVCVLASWAGVEIVIRFYNWRHRRREHSHTRP